VQVVLVSCLVSALNFVRSAGVGAWCWRWCLDFGAGVCARCLRFVHRASGVGVVPCSLLLVHGVGVVPTVGSVHCAGVGAWCKWCWCRAVLAVARAWC